VGSKAVIEVSNNATEFQVAALLDTRPKLLNPTAIEGMQKSKVSPKKAIKIEREKSSRFFTFRAG
jgi:hypothetical protein